MTEQNFRDLEVRRTRAIVARAMETNKRLHTPGYERITPGGHVFTRVRYLAAMAARPFNAAREHGPRQVRASGGMAIVRYPATLTFPSGKAVDDWHTDSYEQRGSTWQAVWSQATMRQPAPIPAGSE